MEVTQEQLDELLTATGHDGVYINDTFYRAGAMYDHANNMYDDITDNIEDLVHCYSGYIHLVTPLHYNIVAVLIDQDMEEALISQIHAMGVEDTGFHWCINADDIANFYGFETLETIIVTCGEECLTVGVFE